jgi:hypothetical protein
MTKKIKIGCVGGGGGQLPHLANTLDTPIILQHVIEPCRIISTCSNTISSAFAQNYIFTHMNNASVKLAKIKTKGHFPHITKANMAAEQISNVIQEW